jgi:hypothetical protein
MIAEVKTASLENPGMGQIFSIVMYGTEVY